MDLWDFGILLNGTRRHSTEDLDFKYCRRASIKTGIIRPNVPRAKLWNLNKLKKVKYWNELWRGHVYACSIGKARPYLPRICNLKVVKVVRGSFDSSGVELWIWTCGQASSLSEIMQQKM